MCVLSDNAIFMCGIVELQLMDSYFQLMYSVFSMSRFGFLNQISLLLHERIRICIHV